MWDSDKVINQNIHMTKTGTVWGKTDGSGQVHKYLDSETIFIHLTLHTSTDLKSNYPELLRFGGNTVWTV